jgi:hypothetical protein
MRAVRTLVATAVAVAGAAALHTGVGAYATFAHWASGPVTFYVNPVNADVSQAAAVAALQAGMDVWNTQAGTSFRYQYGGTATDTATAYDNRNVIMFRNASNGSTIASTYSWWTSNNELVDSDIVFWDGGFTFFTGSSGCGGVSNAAYIEDIAAHELGHALGLNHSSSTDATMYPSYSYCSMEFRSLAADDINGAKALYPTVSNAAPSVTISSPGNGASYASGTAISFSGSASDTQDGSLTAALAWTSNIDGSIGLGGAFSRVLSPGTHTIKATAVDSGGLTTVKQVSVTMAAAASNTAPSVTIASPANGASYAAGTAVSFTGSASDTQDGSLTAALAWISNIDGAIGGGGAFTKVLTAGTHTIKATVTDSGGLTTVKQVSVTVTSASSGGGTLKATGRKNRGLQSVDLSWNGMSGTSLDVYRNSTKWTTQNDGSETDPINKKGSGTYTYKVCAADTATCSNTATVVF